MSSTTLQKVVLTAFACYADPAGHRIPVTPAPANDRFLTSAVASLVSDGYLQKAGSDGGTE